MFGYYLELALRNLKRNPGLTALMIGAVALGIAVCVMTLTMYRAMSGNPIWWKNDVLYAVTMDFWDPDEDYFDAKPGLPPQQLTYDDAMAVYASDIPKRKVIMHKAVGILSVDGQQMKPERGLTRVTTKDFFADFDVPFQLRRHLDGRGRYRPGAGDGHLAQDERQAVRRRQQRRPARALERQRVPHRRRARPLDAAADVLRRQQRRARGARGRLHPLRLECRARAAERRQHQRLEARGHQDLRGLPEFREHLDPDVGRAAGPGQPRPLQGLPRQLRAASRSRAAAIRARSTTG